MHVQSLPLLGSMSNESFVLVNGGYEPVVTMQVGGQDGQGRSHIWWLSSSCTALQPWGASHYIFLHSGTNDRLPPTPPQAGRYQRWRLVNTGAPRCPA